MSNGSPLYAAVIGVASIEDSQAFYEDWIGLTPIARSSGINEPFNVHWHLPSGSHCTVTVLADRGCAVGRIVLIKVRDLHQERIRTVPGQMAYGLINLNFYTANIDANWRAMTAAGMHAWTAPVRHQMAQEVGAPTEVMLEGPDGVIVNLIELTTRDPATRIGQMRAFVEGQFGYNAKGFTPVVTTQHCVRDADAAVRFYEHVLGMEKFIDDVLASPEQNEFMGYPPGTRTRSTFCRGRHPFGKISPTQPLNAAFGDLVPKAVLPNIGYVAHAFQVPDLDLALSRCAELGAPLYSAPQLLEMPDRGRTRAAIVKAPGSGAFQELFEVQSSA